MVNVLTQILGILSAVNGRVLALGRTLGWLCLTLMVLVILVQIFFRYVLNYAMPWPEEGARALMIWMMALVAPSAYRHAGFVSIEMVPDMMPRKPRLLMLLAILLLSLAVLIIMYQHAWAHYSAPLLFDSSGLNRLLQDSGINQLLGTNLKFRTAYISLAMPVMLAMLISVSVELILRMIGQLLYGDEAFPTPAMPVTMGEA